MTGSKLKSVASQSGLTVGAIQKELTDLGIEWDKKMLKPQLEALLPVESKVKIILNSDKNLSYYQLIADRIALEDETEDGMNRGHDLEDEALDKFAEATGKTLYRESVMLVSDANKYIAVSPDSMINDGKKFNEAVEIKCLGSAKYLMAYYEQEIPAEYEEQVLQYFIVNPDFERLYFVFYDPRITALPIHWIVIERKDIEDQLPLYIELQSQILADIEEKVLALTF